MNSVNHKNFCLTKDEIWHIREKIYHSQQDGFFVFRGFLDTRITDHLINYWVKLLDPASTHKLFPGKKNAFHPNCPSYYAHNKKNDLKVFYNPLWSNRHEIVSNEVAFSIIQLRAQIEGKAFTREIMPVVGQRCVIPRLIITKNGKNILMPHSDYSLDEPDSKNIDLARVQATLFLSHVDHDYSGSGFIFTKNNGEKIECERALKIKPGDLLVWRYNNVHEISDISSSSDQIGFVRMLFPPESITRSNGIGNFLDMGKNILRKCKRKFL